MAEPLNVLIVEDEALLQLQLTLMLEDMGHIAAGSASTATSAARAIEAGNFDVALVDIHLADGPTGTDVGRMLESKGIPYMFVTANAGRIPEDFCGAWGVISKPYSEAIMQRALDFLAAAVHAPPPPLPPPSGMQLSPQTQTMWAKPTGA